MANLRRLFMKNLLGRATLTLAIAIAAGLQASGFDIDRNVLLKKPTRQPVSYTDQTCQNKYTCVEQPQEFGAPAKSFDASATANGSDCYCKRGERLSKDIREQN